MKSFYFLPNKNHWVVMNGSPLSIQSSSFWIKKLKNGIWTYKLKGSVPAEHRNDLTAPYFDCSRCHSWMRRKRQIYSERYICFRSFDIWFLCSRRCIKNRSREANSVSLSIHWNRAVHAWKVLNYFKHRAQRLVALQESIFIIRLVSNGFFPNFDSRLLRKTKIGISTWIKCLLPKHLLPSIRQISKMQLLTFQKME